jgi:hypothetical protein
MTIAVLIMLALLGAGCGGDDTASDTVATDTTEDITAEESTDETTTDDGDTTDGSGVFGDGDCASLVAAAASVSQAFAAAGGTDADVEASRELFDEYAANAPDEIRDDLEVLAAAYAEYAEALQDVDIEPGEVPDAEAIAELQQAIASIDQAEVTAASQAVSEWTTANC